MYFRLTRYSQEDMPTQLHSCNKTNSQCYSKSFSLVFKVTATNSVFINLKLKLKISFKFSTCVSGKHVMLKKIAMTTTQL